MDFQTDLNKSVKVLQSGGLLLYPTDTIWGIGCDATKASAVKKIFELKKRPEKKSMIILVSDEKMIFEYVKNPPDLLLEYLQKQTRPTTAIFENAWNLPEELVSDDSTIAIRIVRDEFCRQLIVDFGKPVVSTSANISGAAYPANFLEISTEIKSGVDYIVQHRQDDFKTNEPSSIIKADDQGKIVVIR
jgi:L-threonylcarbamoyladenylate synthase